MMTREEEILKELNRVERRIKAILQCEVVDEEKLDEKIAYLEGMHKMLQLLGYKAVEDVEKAENIDGYWIYTYKAIEDVR